MKELLYRAYWYLFFYNSRSFFAKYFQYWLFQIATSPNTDLRQLLKLINSPVLPGDWEIQGVDRRGRNTILSFRPGYLVVPKNEAVAFVAAFKDWIQKNIKRWGVKPAGISNLLLFCDQLGFLSDDEQWQLSCKIVDTLSDAQLKEAVSAYVFSLNKEVKEQVPEVMGVSAWEELIFRAQYYDGFDDPLHVLSMFLYSGRMSKAEMLLLLKPAFRALAPERMRLPEAASEKDSIINTIKKGGSDSNYLLALVFHYHGNVLAWLDDSSIDQIIELTYAENIGFLLQNTFSPRAIQSKIPVKSCFRERLHRFLKSKAADPDFIQLLKWPQDWEALAFWLWKIHEEKTELDDAFFKEAFIAYTRFFSELSIEILSGPGGRPKNQIIWDVNPHEIRLLHSYLLHGFLQLSEVQRKEVVKSFENSFHKLKESLYTTYTNNSQVLDMLDRFLFLYACGSYLTQLGDQDYQKLRELLDCFKKSILFAYVRYRQSHDSFWDSNYQPSYYSQLALHYLRELISADHPLLHNLCMELNAFSEVEWKYKTD